MSKPKGKPKAPRGTGEGPVGLHTPPNLSPPKDGERPINNSDDKEFKERADKQALLTKIKARYQAGTGAFEENRRMHTEDLNFVYNAETQGQWDPTVLTARIGKPCYTFNRVLGPVNMVIADMRQTMPAGKVRPVNSDASGAVADIMGGLCRSIEDASRAGIIYKQQYKYSVAGGFGAWLVMPRWASDDSFDQVLQILNIPNPQCVVWDPEADDPCCGDAMWGMIGDRISKEKYRSLFSGSDPVSFDMARDSAGWFTGEEVRVVDYFERVPYKKTIALLSDGRVIDYDKKQQATDDDLDDQEGGTAAAAVVKTREVLKWRVMWVKCDGGQILEGPVYYDWKRIPIIRCPGRYINIEGKKKLQSLIRHSKDAQRSYNSRQSDMIERAALIPKAPYLVTQKMIEGYANEWAQSNTQSRPFLPFNIDPDAAKAGVTGGAPFRAQPIDVPQAAVMLAQQSAADIQATTGFFDPALGNADDMNRVSGKALVQHTRRSDLGSYEFIDGFGEAVQLTWEIMIDMIQTTYDTERVERVIGADRVEKLITINQQTDAGQVMNDLRKGIYDCKVTLGPSYQTARQENLDTLINFAEAVPQAAPLIPDLIARNIDIPESDEMARRLRIGLIMQGIVQPTPEEQKQLPKPPPPSPEQQAEQARTVALARRDTANAALAEHKASMLPLTTHKQLLETAGVDLQNLLAAQKAGDAKLAAQAEASVTATSGPTQPSPTQNG